MDLLLAALLLPVSMRFCGNRAGPNFSWVLFEKPELFSRTQRRPAARNRRGDDPLVR